MLPGVGPLGTFTGSYTRTCSIFKTPDPHKFLWTGLTNVLCRFYVCYTYLTPTQMVSQIFSRRNIIFTLYNAWLGDFSQLIWHDLFLKKIKQVWRSFPTTWHRGWQFDRGMLPCSSGNFIPHRECPILLLLKPHHPGNLPGPVILFRRRTADHCYLYPYIIFH